MVENFSLDERIGYLRDYGSHTLAYSTLQSGMEYFDVPHVGFIGYRRYGSLDFVLGNPICAEKDRENLLAMFLAQHSAACFVQITEPVAVLLRDTFQFYTVQVGIETWLNAATWDLTGGAKAHLRRWINTATNAQLRVIEIQPGQHFLERDALQQQWLQSRTNASKLRFLVRDRYTDPACSRLARLFGAYKDSTLMGLVEFDPIFENNKLNGYYADIVQFRNESPNGTGDLIIATAFSTFMKEGTQWLSLGLAPLAKLEPCRNEPPLIREFLSLLYRRANFLYNFQGIYFHKQKYRGEEAPVFYATKHRNAFPDAIRLFRLIGII